jgi:hypothetical protein
MMAMDCTACATRSEHPHTGLVNAACWRCNALELARGPNAHKAFSTGQVGPLWDATQRIFPSPLWDWARSEVRRFWGKTP